MKSTKSFFAVFLSAIWIVLSEFFRNELLFKRYWTDHYDSLGLEFPSNPINGIVWAIWSILLAISIYILLKRFSLMQTAFIAFIMAFMLMWLVIGNLNVLPFGILYFAVPLAFLEVWIAAFIINRMK